MFDIGFSELVVCFVVALVVLGPERLPVVARTVGRWTGQAKSYLRNLSAELDRETQVGELKRQLQEAKAAIEDRTTALDNNLRETQSQITQNVDEVRRIIEPPKP